MNLICSLFLISLSNCLFSNLCLPKQKGFIALGLNFQEERLPMHESGVHCLRIAGKNG